ncbi:MAG: hypothetical protein AAF899_10020 [Pseudomonadota bacterium]
MLSLEHTVPDLRRELSDIARRQMPFALAQAINRVGAAVKRAADRLLVRKLDRPTPFTRRAFRLSKARKSRPVATVFAMDRQAAYLATLEEGGTRQPARRALLVPVGQRVNRYGNLPRGSVGRAVADPRVFTGVPRGKGANAAGIYRRTGRGGRGRLKLLVAFEGVARYRPQLGFVHQSRRVAVRLLPAAVAGALDAALRSRR